MTLDFKKIADATQTAIGLILLAILIVICSIVLEYRFQGSITITADTFVTAILGSGAIVLAVAELSKRE